MIDTLSRSRAAPSARTVDAALAQLVSRCADQDVAALELLYRRTSPWISHLIEQRITSTADVDDTLVAVYAAVWRRAPGFAAMNRTALAWATSITFEIQNRASPASG
jgi:DNA-directed RNA polymerase specialized sigma24 family protein